jgi:hypothetical protein
MTRISLLAGALAALVVGAIPAHAQLMNESSQVTPGPGSYTMGEPGMGMSDVVEPLGPPRTLFGYFRRDKSSVRNRRILRED